MKAIRPNLKWIAPVLCILILSQSCIAYKNNYTTKKDAINSVSRLKIKVDGETYKVNSLEEKNGRLYTVARRNSKITKHFESKIVNDSKRYVQIDITNQLLESIQEQDKSASTIYTVLTIIATLGVAWITIIALGSISPFG